MSRLPFSMVGLSAVVLLSSCYLSDEPAMAPRSDSGVPVMADAAGGCEGVVCNDSGNTCLSNAGVCMGDGICVYPPDDRASCDDSDACTISDRCSEGICAGTPMACDTPGAPVCVDGNTLRTFAGSSSCSAGGCGYPSNDTVCAEGCFEGACLDPASPIEALEAYLKASNTDRRDAFGLLGFALSGNGNMLAVGATGKTARA